MTTKADDPRYATTGGPVAPGYEDAGAPQPIDPATGQHGAYWVLSEEERKRGWVRPLRVSYVHDTCGGKTTMGLALAETYAREPTFYGATFCCTCRAHFPVAQFRWATDGTVVGT